jgi:hypothetical protein
MGFDGCAGEQVICGCLGLRIDVMNPTQSCVDPTATWVQSIAVDFDFAPARNGFRDFVAILQL